MAGRYSHPGNGPSPFEDELFRETLRDRWSGPGVFIGIDWAAGEPEQPQRDPSPEELTAAVPRLRRVLDEYRSSGKLKEAVRFWKDRSAELDARRRGKAAIVLGSALASMSEGEAP